MISYNTQKADIKLYFLKPFFYVGEFIIGDIEINLKTSAIITGITIKISANENWKIDKSDNNSNNYYKTIINFNLDLKNFKHLNFINAKDILLPQGKTKIPFNFRFSEEYCPSFEFPLPDKRAFVRYTFSVKFNSQYIDAYSTYYLCLKSRPIIDSEKLLNKSINQHIKKWKIFDKGDTILKLTLPENNFTYDSEPMITIEIDNKVGLAATKEYKVMLIRRIVFKNNLGEVKNKDETNIVSERVKAVVQPGKTGTFEYKLKFREKDTNKKYNYNQEINPYNPDLREINFYMPTLHGNIISCDYEIKISLYFECFVDYNHRPRVIIPVYLVHQLPLDYQLEIQEQIDYENALMNSKIDLLNEVNNKNKQYDDYNNINKNNINNNIENDNHNNNHIQNNIIEEEDDALPSLEDIEQAKKDNNMIKENNNNNNNIDITNEENGLESAPAPFFMKNEQIENNNNNHFPDYNSFKINENIAGNNYNNFNNNINENSNINEISNINKNSNINEDNNKNENNNINNIPKKEFENFSIFDRESINSGNNIDTNSEAENVPKNIYQNINEE
jgi:hypothetical protein